MVTGFNEKSTGNLAGFLSRNFLTRAVFPGLCVMPNPKRILTKLLGDSARVDPLIETAEPLDLIAQSLRDVVKCRRTRKFMLDEFAIDLAISPATFDKLLDIAKINFVETPTRTLEMEIVSLRETRKPNEPVSVGNLNSVLRELYSSLNTIHETYKKDYPDLLLAEEMTGEHLDPVAEHITVLRSLNGQLTGFLLTGRKAKGVEKKFQQQFPRSLKAHPLRRTLPTVEREMEFYRACQKANKKWSALGLDIFPMLRENKLKQALENIEEMGTLLWNIVYNNPPVEKSLKITGIHFEDVRPLFDEELVPVSNF